jgi:hypothetical protein
MEFTTPNIVVANPIPDETRIYYSKTKALTTIIFSAFVLILGVYLLTLGVDYFAGAILCFVIGCVFIHFKYKNFTDDQPQIILNINGLQTIGNPFYIWSDINEAGVKKLEIGRSNFYHLTYKTVQGVELSIRIDNFNISVKNLRLLLHFYKEKNKNSDFTYFDLRGFTSKNELDV